MALVTIFSVFVLGVIRFMTHETSQSGFFRSISESFVSNSRYVDLDMHNCYIAGLTDDQIYLGSYSYRSSLIVTDYNLKDTRVLKLKAKKGYRFAWQASTLCVNYPDIYATENISPAILKGSFPLLEMEMELNSVASSISKFTPIGENGFVFRSFDTLLGVNVLSLAERQAEIVTVKLNSETKNRFSDDGMLLYSARNDQVIYLYYYRNRFLRFDNILNPISEGRTIDTNTVAKIKVDTIHSEKRITFSAPPRFVNKKSCVYDNYLFVNSNILADNEKNIDLDSRSVIDVYDLTENTYRFSFYVPSFHGDLLTDFKIYGDKLAVVYNHFIGIYDLNIDSPLR